MNLINYTLKNKKKDFMELSFRVVSFTANHNVKQNYNGLQYIFFLNLFLQIYPTIVDSFG